MYRGSFGGSSQTGGAFLTWDDAFLLFDKWAEEGSRLRLDAELSTCRLSCEGFISAVRGNIVDLRLDSLGFISIRLPENTVFGWGDPETLAVKPTNRIGKRHSGEAVTYGSALPAITDNGNRFFFVELIETV